MTGFSIYIPSFRNFQLIAVLKANFTGPVPGQKSVEMVLWKSKLCFTLGWIIHGIFRKKAVGGRRMNVL